MEKLYLKRLSGGIKEKRLETFQQVMMMIKATLQLYHKTETPNGVRSLLTIIAAGLIVVMEVLK